MLHVERLLASRPSGGRGHRQSRPKGDAGPVFLSEILSHLA